MQVSVAVADDGTITVSGELDGFSAPQLAEPLEERIVTPSETVVVDLSAVTFIDSSALQILLEYHRRFDEGGGRLEVSAPSPAVRRLFEISGLDDHFHVAGV